MTLLYICHAHIAALFPGRPLFHQVILMSGSDLCDWSVVGPHYFTNPFEYTQELGRKVGCDPDYGVPTETLMECMRSKHFEEIVNASASVWRKVRGSRYQIFTNLIFS